MKIKIILIGCLLCALSAFAQKNGKENLKKAEREAKEERQRAFGGLRDESNLKHTKRTLPRNQQSKVTEGAQEQPDNGTPQNSGQSKEVIERNSDQPVAKNKNASDSSGNQSAPPAVIQRTTSESGSPSMLSADNGRGRDGTNNVQRSSINVAGSPMRGNYNLDAKNRGEQNQKVDSTRIQKQKVNVSAATKNHSNEKETMGKNKTEHAKGKPNRQKG
jgi:hypothetical protein